MTTWRPLQNTEFSRFIHNSMETLEEIIRLYSIVFHYRKIALINFPKRVPAKAYIINGIIDSTPHCKQQHGVDFICMSVIITCFIRLSLLKPIIHPHTRPHHAHYPPHTATPCTLPAHTATLCTPPPLIHFTNQSRSYPLILCTSNLS